MNHYQFNRILLKGKNKTGPVCRLAVLVVLMIGGGAEVLAVNQAPNLPPATEGQAAEVQQLSMAITPSLLDISVEPGGIWRSEVKLVNNNPYSLTLSITPAELSTRGDETGIAAFRPLDEEMTEQGSPAAWLEPESDKVTIPPESGKDITFTIRVPEDAPPGGHYTALLFSTAAGPRGEGSELRVSSQLTSMFLIRVAGDIDEGARLREFRTTAGWLSKPQTEFLIRLQNTGNVHLRPRGRITVHNMWGRERGVIELSPDGQFGNVLPDSTRRFNYGWEGDLSFADIGRYTAELELSYGDSGRTITDRVTFWIMPLQPLAIGMGALLLFLVVLFLAVRSYVRRAIALEQSARDGKISWRVMAAPVREGVIDMKQALGGDRETATSAGLLAKYRRALVLLLLLLILLSLLGLYWTQGRAAARGFRAYLEQPSSEDLLE